MKITQQQLESILINEGVIQAAAIEDPEGYDGGKTELAMTIATQQINEIIEPLAGIEPCVWVGKEHGWWHADCGKIFRFMGGGTPEENEATYCPFCGRTIKVKL